jgi:DNA-binding beta-propeller fold protein YncE
MLRPEIPRNAQAIGAAVLILACLLGGCAAPGDEQSGEQSGAQSRPPGTGASLPQTPAAEPGEAPRPSGAPSGRIIRLPGGAPEGAAIDPSTHTLAIALRKPGRLALVDTLTGKVRTVPSPGTARHVSVVGPGELAVSGEDTGTLSTVRLPSGRVIGEAKVGRTPHDAARVGHKLFVSNEFGRSVSVVQSGRVVGRVSGFAQPGGLTAIGGRVVAVDVRTNTVHVIDAATLRTLAVLPAGKGPSHVRPIGDGRVAVADTRGNAVLSYQVTGTPRQLGRVPVAGRAYGLDTDPGRGFVYATAGNTNKVFRLRAGADGRLSLARQLSTVHQPNDVAVDPRSGTVYVIGQTGAQVQTLAPDAFG